MMKYIWLWAAAMMMITAGAVHGETVHLTSGESIKGRITRVDEDSIAIESDKGFGEIEIQRSEITLIEFEEALRNPDHRMAFGYLHRVNPNSAGGNAIEYGTDGFSVKYFISSVDSVNFVVGFFSTEDASAKVYEVFSFDVRYANVFQRQANLDLYYGASVGIINVTDNTGVKTIEETGNSYGAFLGTELFFPTLPNLGISAEVGIRNQTLGDRTVTSISTSTFPTFSLHYYF